MLYRTRDYLLTPEKEYETVGFVPNVYVHCDWRVNSYIRLALNEVFGENSFQNEITWRRTRTHNDATSWAAIADTILFFSRSENFIWNQQFNEQSEEDVETRYRFTDEKGRRYRLGPIDSPNPRPNMMYFWKGFPPPKKGWRYSREKMAELDREGRIYYPDSKDKRPATKLYLDESQGALVGTVWTEFSAVQASATERVDYPTQKPEAMLERIIKASSSEGDLVPDFFCGSGTTAAVAEKLGRKWIATDLGNEYRRMIREFQMGKTSGNYRIVLDNIESEMTFPLQEIDTVHATPEVTE